MAIDWNGLLVSVVDSGSESIEKRIHRQILFAGLIAFVLIVVWRVTK